MILVLVLVPLLVLGSGVAWFLWQLDGHGARARGARAARARLGCPAGSPTSSTQQAHRRLRVAFNIYARFNGDNSFQAGTYDLHKNIGVKAAVSALKKGPRIDYVVLTVPPGLWLKQIAAPGRRRCRGRDAQPFLDGHAQQRGAVAVRAGRRREPRGPAAARHLQDLGSRRTRSRSSRRMVTTFDKHAPKLGLANANVQGHTAYDIIKVGVARSSPRPRCRQDRPLIASVIYNRLAREHAAADRRDRHLRARRSRRTGSCRRATSRTSSRRTTRTCTPGCRPRRSAAVSDASLRAAMAPAQTDYLYYVLAGKDGHHAFSSTLERAAAEHRGGRGRRRLL